MRIRWKTQVELVTIIELVDNYIDDLPSSEVLNVSKEIRKI